MSSGMWILANSMLALGFAIWCLFEAFALKRSLGKLKDLVSKKDEDLSKDIGKYKNMACELRDEIIPEFREEVRSALFAGRDKNSPVYATRTSVAEVKTVVEQIQLDLGPYKTKYGVLSLTRPEDVSENTLSKEEFGKFKNDLPSIVWKAIEEREEYLAFQKSPFAPLGEKGLSTRDALALVEAGFDSLEKVASLKKDGDDWDRFAGVLESADPGLCVKAAAEAISETEKKKELETENAAFKSYFLTEKVKDFNFSVWKKLKDAGFLEPKDFFSASSEKNLAKFAKLAEIFGGNNKALEVIKIAKEAAKEAKAAENKAKDRVAAEIVPASENPSSAADSNETRIGGKSKRRSVKKDVE